MRFICLDYKEWLKCIPERIYILVLNYKTYIDINTHNIKRDIKEVVKSFNRTNRVLFYKSKRGTYYCVLYFKNKVTIFYTNGYTIFEDDKLRSRISYFKKKIKKLMKRAIKERENDRQGGKITTQDS